MAISEPRLTTAWQEFILDYQITWPDLIVLLRLVDNDWDGDVLMTGV